MTSINPITSQDPNYPVQEAKKSSGLSITSFAGMIAGSMAGVGVNVWNNASLFAKCIITTKTASGILDNGKCFNPLTKYDFNILGHPVFKAINQLKQEEIKRFAFAIPYAPLITDIAITTLSKTYEKGSKAGLLELANRIGTLPMEKLLAPVITCVIGVFARPYIGHALASSNAADILFKFNPSGHVITKLASALALYEAVDAVEDHVQVTQGSTKRLTLAALQVITIVATDALMMYHTGAIHHSAAELLAGGLIFTAAYPLGRLASKGICKVTSSVANKISEWAFGKN